MNKLLVIITAAFFTACGGGDSNDNGDLSTAKGSVSGFVTDNNSGAILDGVTVKAAGREITTGNDGAYEISDIEIGEETISALKPGYSNYSSKVNITEGQITSHDIVLLSVVVTTHKSCLEILNAGESVGDGVYTIDADGDGFLESFDVYCDMTIEGGGWTLFANHEDGVTTVNTKEKVTTEEIGVLKKEYWQAVRDNLSVGMLFIDENNLMSMISVNKLKTGNCKKIDETSDLIELSAYPHSLWHNENSGCSGTGQDYTLAILADQSYSSYAIAGASLFQGSDQKFDIWPYSSWISDPEQNKLLYFIK